MKEQSQGEKRGGLVIEPAVIEKDAYNFYIGINAGGRIISSIQRAKKSVKIISPFLSDAGIEELREKSYGKIEDISLITAASDENLEKPWYVKALKGLIHRETMEGGRYSYSSNFRTVFFRGDFVHTKLYIIDGVIAYTGSVNFTGKGMEKNHEACITIKDEDTVKELDAYYERLFAANLRKWTDINELGRKVYTPGRGGKSNLILSLSGGML
jgi:phosphatidylserine/phosphatidylglycerophosphate/cardiolipin synthase-like enzyme